MITLVIGIFFIMGLAIGASSQGSLTFGNDTLSSWVSALATVCIALLTIVLAKETWELRRVQLSQIEQIRKDSIKPSVSLYLKHSPVSFNFMDVHVINSGVGTAQNIKFKFMNKSKNAQDVYDYLQGQFGKLVILSNGISSLGAGEKRTSYVFSFIELRNKFGPKSLEYLAEVDIEFQDIEGKTYTSVSYFNFSEYTGISKLGSDPVHKISSTLEKIQKEIGHFASGFKKLRTDIYTSSDRQKEKEEMEKQIEQRKQSK